MCIHLLALLVAFVPNPDLTLEEAVRANNQGSHLHQLARLAEADQAYRLALQRLSQVPDADPLTRATFLSNHALLLKDSGELDEALARIEEALRIRRQYLPQSHPDIAASLSNLGHIVFAKGDYPRAGDYYEQALEMRRELLAADDPRLAESLANVALMQKLKGDLRQSNRTFEDALAILLPKLPATHSAVSSVHHNLAANFMALSEWKLARSHLQKALALAETHLAPGHHLLAPLLISLSSLEITQGNLRASQQWLDRARSIQAKYFAPGAPQHSETDRLEIVLLTRQNHWDDAEPLLYKVRDQLTRSLGAEHLELTDIYSLLGELCTRRKNYAAAKEYFARAIRITERAFGPRAPSLVSLLARYSRLLRREEQYAEAAKIEQQLQTIEVRSAIARGSLPGAKGFH
jgi:tetratricopeptide (TPR) repeat protein